MPCRVKPFAAKYGYEPKSDLPPGNRLAANRPQTSFRRESDRH